MRKEFIGFFLRGRLICAISVDGLFEGEIENTIELLAYENKVSPLLIGIDLIKG